jgi:hypothetical protein
MATFTGVKTLSLESNSPALDAGDDGVCQNNIYLQYGLPVDERLFARTVGSACDIGAFEYGAAPVPTPAPTP